MSLPAPGSNINAFPGDQVSVNGLVQLTVGSLSVEAYVPAGVRVEVKGNQVVFTRDPLSALPRLAEVKDAVLARAEAAGGARAVHRLTGALNGVLARYPDALVSSNTGWNPVWSGPRTPGTVAGVEAPPAGNLADPIGCIFRDAGGYWMGRTIAGAGILGREWRWTPRG